ncbi:swarming motility protein SwrC [Cohnella xylanilytica]|uniref:efflux RND transporter permease subunit n=1 Tax=Cohnella xylanilytica TaxID=557555 RepID=UPI001B226CF1|nr:efflux RND transporter permease subunit [Cohnella xylanilytica]GIO14636.1 swarming motility protein SwrC [Cohnella xylanilytica]
MKGLISFAMNKVAAMVIIIIILLGAGLYSGNSLKKENMPDVSFPVVLVTTFYQASPQDVMNLVTKPIEDKIANVEDLKILSSTSSDSMSSIIAQFKDGTDIDKKKQDLDSLVQEVALPSSAERPRVSTFGYASIPAYYLAVYAKDGMTQEELDRLYETELKPGFESIRGIDHIDSIGARTTTLDVQLNLETLNAYGLTPSYVADTLQGALAEGSIGTVELDGNKQIARVKGNLNSLYLLETLEINAPGGQVLLLKDLADVKAVSESAFIARLDDKPAIGINLYKASSANAVDFSDEANRLIEEWENKHPNIVFEKAYDSADEVNESISGLLREGLIGIALASLMILLFLRNVRMTLIVIVSIPLSILITLILLHYMNITLNIMSLGGMFIAVGRIVDDSIVVIESIYANLQRAQKRNESVVLYAVRQVAMAISSSTFVTAGVFLPIAFVSGIVGGFFRPFAFTVACALLASLLVALTVIPMMAKLMVLRGDAKHAHAEEHGSGKILTFYERILVWCLNHRIKTVLLSGALFVMTIFVTVPNLPVAFLPDSGTERQMNFSVKLPYETPFESTDQQAKQIEELLREAKDMKGQPAFTFVEALVGYDFGDERVPYAIEIVTEASENSDPEALKEQYEARIAALLPKGSVVLPGSLAGGSGYTSTDFSYALYGEDQQALEQAAALVKGKLREFPEIKEVKDSLGDAKTEVQISVNPLSARQFGLSPAQIRGAAAAFIAKQRLGDIRLDNVVYKMTVGLAPGDIDSLEKLGRMPLQSSTGETVLLRDVAKLTKEKAPLALQREKQKQLVKVTASIDSPNKAAISAKVSAELAELELPQGVATELQGVSEDIDESFSQLFAAMAVAVAIVYLILVLCFGNAGTPLAILFSLPLAVIGGLFGLLVARESINITSLIGFMMLIGIVVTNAIVLLDRAQQLRREGQSPRDALIEAGKVRLRPIIMTAGATIAAMIPLALGFSHGTLISKGLAVVVIGGLITSTLLTLVVVPVAYEWIETFKSKWGRRLSGRKPQPDAPEGIPM